MKANKFPLVSIISVNYNGLSVTIDMIESLKKISYPALEIIIVDNNSKEDPDEIMSLYPDVILVKNTVNLGFAGGNNRGIEISKGEFILLLNNDTLVSEGFLEPLVNRALANNKIGLISPKLVYYEDPTIIQFAGYTDINPITGRGHGIGYNEKDVGQYDKAVKTSRGHGAAMFLPRSVINQIGIMPEIYFLYYEEMDYCEKIKKGGYEIWYEPASKVIHKESMAVGKNSTLKTYYMSRNRLLYLRRNVSYPLFIVTLIYYLFIASSKNLLVFMVGGEWLHFKAYWRGLLWHLRRYQVKYDSRIPTDDF